jgi:hypothetical protein
LNPGDNCPVWAQQKGNAMSRMMISKVIATVAGKSNKDKAGAQRRYAELLRSDSAEPSAVEEMEVILSILGKSPTDATLDHQVVKESMRIEAIIAAGCVTEAEREVARKAMRDHTAESMRLDDLRFKEFERLRRASGDLEGRYVGAQHWLGQLKKLRGEHGQLFVGVPMPVIA